MVMGRGCELGSLSWLLGPWLPRSVVSWRGEPAGGPKRGELRASAAECWVRAKRARQESTTGEWTGGAATGVNGSEEAGNDVNGATGQRRSRQLAIVIER